MDTANGNATVTPGENNSVAVTKGSDIVCTFTNTRDTGKIELKKHWVGTAGSVTINIGTSAGGSQTATANANGVDNTTGAKTVDTGTFYVSESPNPPTNYSAALACVDTANGNATVTPGANNSIAVTKGSDIVCTFTNTRDSASIELKKHWAGTAGNVTINIEYSHR